MENDYNREDAEFEQEKEEGFYQPAKNAENASTTQNKGNMAIGAISALIGSVVIFIAAGYFLDRFLNTSPWLIVSGVILGAVIGFYQFISISGKNN